MASFWTRYMMISSCISVYMVLFLACNTQASEVMLTSNLTSGNLAYNDQVIVFRCVARGTILVWESDHYIGPIADGRDLRLTFVDQPGHTESSQLVDGTVASLISVTDANGDTIIESELRIMASLATSLSSAVTCTNNGRGGRNTSEFRVVSRTVELTSNLTDGNIAYDNQVIVFRCIMRGTILVWQSDDYIGPIADGRDLRLTFVDPPGHTEHSQLVDGTVARIISIIEDMDGTLIDSELVIRASLSMRNASVTCTNNGLGRMNTTYFRVTERPSVTTTPGTLTESTESSTAVLSVDSSTGGTSTEESVSNPGPQDGSNDGVAIGVSVVLITAVTIAIIIAVVCIYIIKRHMHEEILKPTDHIEKGDGLKGEYKVQPIDQPPPPPGNHTPPDVSKQPESTINENDPIDLVEVPCICSEPEGNSGMLVSSPDPKGQLEDFRLTEAKQNVENPEGFPGDIGASGASEEFEGKADGPLSPFEAIGFQEAVGCDYDVGPKEDTMVHEPINESGTDNLKTVLVSGTTYIERSARVATSLPVGCCITSEQSYTEAETKPASLPLPLLGNKGFTQHQRDMYFHGIVTPQPPELDTDNESDPDTGASPDLLNTLLYLPLKSLRPHPNGDPLMISGDILNTSGSETDSRPQLEIESNMQVPELEVVKTVADTHSEANKKQESVFHVVEVVRT